MSYWRNPVPAPADTRETAISVEDFDRACAGAGLAAPADRSVLDGRLADLAFYSPYLRDLAVKQPALFLDLARSGSARALDAVWDDCAQGRFAGAAQAEVMRRLRRLKARLALTVAYGDLFEDWPLSRVTRALSRFAELALERTIDFLLGQAAARGELDLPDMARPAQDCGLFVLGMGKLGGRELNYSSDIDLIVFYEREAVRYAGRRTMQEMFVRMVQALVGILQERTSDGYVFRIDLALRPDPGAMPVALPTEAAEIYYSSVGQNWERAAMIKARVVAGDRAAGAAFLGRLRPFLWRRHLDFPAVRDLRRMKALIGAHHRHGPIGVEGQDVKLGPGGIREIEFFAQIQQLVLGGRVPALRAAPTLDALDALVADGRLAPGDRDLLAAAYDVLRRVEHRLQMIADQQTHLIPRDGAQVDRVARFCGFQDTQAFRIALTTHLQAVHRLFHELYAGEETEEALPVEPSAMEEPLAGQGFADPEKAARLISGWRAGRYRCFREERARLLLEPLLPPLLRALGATGSPDAALLRLDEFFAHQRAGVQLLSLLDANRALLDLLAEVMGTAPLLARTLAARPALLDTVASGEALRPPGDAAALAQELRTALWDARDTQDVLDGVRRWSAERRFSVGLQLLRGLIDRRTAGHAFTDVAQLSLETLLGRVQADFETVHGRFPGGAFGVLAYGKLGGRELSVASDLDLVFLFAVPDGSTASDGGRPLTPGLYYTRLAQRLIAALSAPTAEGPLYEVDMELRPGGRGGEIAQSLPGFTDYMLTRAWTWEHLALTRARVAAATDPGFRTRLEGELERLKRLERPAGRLKRDAAAMRGRMDKDRPPRHDRDLKLAPGGLVDIEFIAQTGLLAAASGLPAPLPTDTRGMLEAAAFPPAATAALVAAHRLFDTVLGLLRLTAGEDANLDALPASLLRHLEEAAGPSGDLGGRLDRARAQVRLLFTELVGDPATAYRPGDTTTTGPLLRRDNPSEEASS